MYFLQLTTFQFIDFPSLENLLSFRFACKKLKIYFCRERKHQQQQMDTLGEWKVLVKIENTEILLFNKH